VNGVSCPGRVTGTGLNSASMSFSVPRIPRVFGSWLASSGFFFRFEPGLRFPVEWVEMVDTEEDEEFSCA
jgi:hypothetical protein